jgi:hypothetical protein
MLDQEFVVDAADLTTSAFATRLLSRLKSEIVFHHAGVSLQILIILGSFV